MSASAVGGRREVELTFSHIHTHTHTHTHTLSLSLSQLVQLVELIQAFSSLHRRPQLYSSYLPRRLTSGFGLRAVQKKSRIVPSATSCFALDSTAPFPVLFSSWTLYRLLSRLFFSGVLPFSIMSVSTLQRDTAFQVRSLVCLPRATTMLDPGIADRLRSLSLCVCV